MGWKEATLIYSIVKYSNKAIRKVEIRYKDDGRWFDLENPLTGIAPCEGKHLYRFAGILFMEDGSAIRAWFCSCGTWWELNHQRNADYQIWKREFYPKE